MASLAKMLTDITGCTGEAVPSGSSGHNGKTFASPSFLRKGINGSMRKRRNSWIPGQASPSAARQQASNTDVLGSPDMGTREKRGEPLDLTADAENEAANNMSPSNFRKRRMSDNGTRLVAAAAAAASAMGSAMFGTNSPPAARSSNPSGSRDTTPYGGRPPNGQHSAPDADGAPIAWTIIATA